MQSRMDKYNNSTSSVKSRTEKNQNLYENVKNSSLTDFDVNSNMSVIDDSSNVINVTKIKQILDDKYKENMPRRKSIDIPDYEEVEEEETSYDTKEYDINAILSKAKQGKNIDYNKERLRKIRDAQYEILNNLDLELKKIEEPTVNHKKKKEEEDLMNLINTITQIEAINKEKYSKDVSSALDLLELGSEEESTTELEIKKDLQKTEEENENNNDNNATATIEITEIDIDMTKQYDEDELDETSESNVLEESDEEEEIEDEESDDTDEEDDEDEVDETSENTVEETLSKLEIDLNGYEDFKDIDGRDKSSIIIKIIIFVVIICLIAGAIFILNNILNLGLF